MAMEPQPGPEIWGRSRLRPRSMPLPPRNEDELFTTEALRPRSAGQDYARQYSLDPEPTRTSPPEQETPRGPDEAAGHSAGFGAIFLAYVHAAWFRAREHIRNIPELTRKARQARVPPPPELPWPLECAGGSWRRLSARVVLVFFLLSLAVPFAFGFVVFTARRVMLTTRTPVYLAIHEPLLDLADSVSAANWHLTAYNVHGGLSGVGLQHDDLCTRQRPKFPQEPPSMDLVCDGESMYDVWNAYSFGWDSEWHKANFQALGLASYAGDISMGGRFYRDGKSEPYYADRLRHYMRILDLSVLVQRDMGPGVEATLAAAYPRWALYKKKNRRAYDPNAPRMKHNWIGLRLSSVLHVVNRALRLAAHVEDFLPVYRAVYEESQSRCYARPKKFYGDPNNLFQRASRAISMFIPAEEPQEPKIPCLPWLSKCIRSSEREAEILRNYTIPIVGAIARVEALRCGLRQINEQYMPRGAFPGVWGSTSKQCGQDSGGSALLRLWKWFVAGEAWPEAAQKSCYGSVDGETCLRTDYGTVASMPPSHVDKKWVYPSKSNCLLGAVKSCGALSTDPFWHIRNAQLPDSSHERDPSVTHLYGFSDQPMEQSSTLEFASEAPLMGERRRKYNAWKIYAGGGKMPSACQIAQATAAEVWHWLSGYLVVPFRFWQFLVAFSRGCGQYAAAMIWPLAQPVILPSAETVHNMTDRVRYKI